jgi:hypothetical protein
MAYAGIVIKGEYPDLKALGSSIASLGDKSFTAKTLKAAIAVAIKPALERLKQITPVGPTGNLRAAATTLVKAYPKDGGAVGLIGYRRSGQRDSESAQGGTVRRTKGSKGDRAYHQWMIEFGTTSRAIRKPIALKPFTRKSPVLPYVRVRNGQAETVRGRGVMHEVRPPAGTYYIASSFNELGPFKFVKNSAGGVQTDPQYPNAFFMKKRGSLVLPPVRPGGRAGVPPLRTAFMQTQGQVAAVLQERLRISFEAAVSTLVLKTSGTISGV